MDGLFLAATAQLIETMVWISPSWNVSESVILDKIKNKDEDKK